MSFFKFSKEYTTTFGYKVRVLNIERIYSTSDSDLSLSLLDGDCILIDKKDYYALEEYLLYESDDDSQSSSERDSGDGSEAGSEGESEGESEDESEEGEEDTEEQDSDGHVPYNAPSSGYRLLRWII
jgi:hypothetical protein